MIKKSEKPCNTIDTLIGVSTEIKGDISFTGGLRIDGKIKGNITAAGDGSSTLVLSEHAEVVGDIQVPHMILNGKIEGNVHCAEHVELQPEAQIIGDVHYQIIEMALGATVNGNLVREEGMADAQKGNVAKLKSVSGSSDSVSDDG
ncbi:MAG: polymer-forming cytoskeletal protein [Acidiferrobacterales bacterium]